MSFRKNLKEAVGFQILKFKEENLLALEVASHVIYVAHEYSKDKKAVKGLNSLISISLAKAYYHLFGVNHKACYYWRCRIREVCLKLKCQKKVYILFLKSG